MDPILGAILKRDKADLRWLAETDSRWVTPGGSITEQAIADRHTLLARLDEAEAAHMRTLDALVHVETHALAVTEREVALREATTPMTDDLELAAVRDALTEYDAWSNDPMSDFGPDMYRAMQGAVVSAARVLVRGRLTDSFYCVACAVRLPTEGAYCEECRLATAPEAEC